MIQARSGTRGEIEHLHHSIVVDSTYPEDCDVDVAGCPAKEVWDFNGCGDVRGRQFCDSQEGSTTGY